METNEAKLSWSYQFTITDPYNHIVDVIYRYACDAVEQQLVLEQESFDFDLYLEALETEDKTKRYHFVAKESK
jgi:hypothetical protein